MEERDRCLLADLRAAYRNKRQLREAVLQWMSDEADAMRLRQNGEAPMWAEYLQADARLADQMARLGEE